MPKRIVFSGGPGVGKTTLIEELKRHKFSVTNEVFTNLFTNWQKNNQFDTIFKNHEFMINELIQAQIAEESSLSNNNIISIFDRGFIDIIMFCNEINYHLNPSQNKLIHQYTYDYVFIPEPLNKEHYDQNNIRTQSYEGSLIRHKICLETYTNYFKKVDQNWQKKVIIIPSFSRKKEISFIERTKFILNKINELSK